MEGRGAEVKGARAVVVSADMITPYGVGIDASWNGILSGRTAIARLMRFGTGAFQSDSAGTVPGLVYHKGDSLVMQMLGILFERASGKTPGDSRLILATTKGEIDLLEEHILYGKGEAGDCGLGNLLKKVAGLAGVNDRGMIVSAACTSSASAAARAAAMIKTGQTDCVLVVACDGVTEFVYSGFSSLMALDRRVAMPFDRNRSGLSIGEACAYALIMSGERAQRERRDVMGEVLGWGLSDDANHMTGPDRDGEGMKLAVRNALSRSHLGAEKVGLVSAHGTGTVYNDAMEMKAFHSVFEEKAAPVYSIKGGIGHTMGAAGLVEMIIAMRSLREGIAPGTVNLKEPDDCSKGWASPGKRSLDGKGVALVTNAGFSGINTALVVA